jgi:predicted RNase H-like HicB family nuclease
MLTYYAIFYKLDDKEWGVRFPDAPSIHTIGHDQNEALEMAIDALSGMLVVGRKGREYQAPSSYEEVIAMAKNGEVVFPVVPNEKIMEEYSPKKRVNVMLPVDRLDTIAEIIKESEGLDRSKFITKAIDYYVDNLGKEAAR